MAAEGDIDRIVCEAFFPTRTNGVMVEVGAARPDYLSISASFRDMGWKVVSIEPNPEFCAAHRAQGHNVLEYACSDEDADNADFFVVDSKGESYLDGTVSYESFSSLGIEGDFAGLYETTMKSKANLKIIPVKVRKLDTILALHEPQLGEIDLLAVDVEGWEVRVMRSLSIQRFCPKVVILENLFKDANYGAFMREQGYTLWRSVEPNEIYVANSFLDQVEGSATVRNSASISTNDRPISIVHSFAMSLDLNEAIQRAMHDGTYEPVQTKWVSNLLQPGNRFVDVGASFGYYSALASHIVGPSGRVFAFEPSPLPAGAIAKFVAANGITNIELIQAAVGHQNGDIDIYLPSNDVVHSPSVFNESPDFTPLKVPMISLDSFAPLNDGRIIDLMKIDVEGFEPNAIAGMQELGRRGLIRNIMCEFNTGWLRHNPGITAKSLLDLILGLGFSIRDKTEKTTHLERDGVRTFELQDILFSWSPTYTKSLKT